MRRRSLAAVLAALAVLPSGGDENPSSTGRVKIYKN